MAAAGEIAQRLLALGIVLDLKIAIVHSRFALEALGAGIGGLVEALVELAAKVIDHGGLDLLGGHLSGEQHCRSRGEPFQMHHLLPAYRCCLSTSPFGQPNGKIGPVAAMPRQPPVCRQIGMA